MQKVINKIMSQSRERGKQPEKGNSEPIQSLLGDDLGDIKKGDRLYPIKRHLLLTLVQQSYEQQDNQTWVNWAKEWYQQDNRDVTAMAYYYAALLQNDKDYEKGMLGLKEAVDRLKNQFFDRRGKSHPSLQKPVQDAIN
ncbi:MAG: hypothetical protein H0A75_06785 [Candidatus Methanofishera endochildressiae]|uniref:Uncharacterized protein n=1 Tax=Candidatus Methanofishera endochildressiae TaxID=2738884 RepID=A0A7Z0MPJ3_9GAMM|nr:hypothetical protein [Candidatus Methanofishera endochildressiae]